MRDTLKRIEKLEARTLNREPPRVIHQIITPGHPYDPQWARGNGYDPRADGMRLHRNDGESAEAFEMRALAEIPGTVIMEGDHARSA